MFSVRRSAVMRRRTLLSLCFDDDGLSGMSAQPTEEGMVGCMDALISLLGRLAGYRTHLAAAAAVLMAAATLVGVLPIANGGAIVAALLAVAQVFQRIATSNAETRLGELILLSTRLSDGPPPTDPNAPVAVDPHEPPPTIPMAATFTSSGAAIVRERPVTPEMGASSPTSVNKGSFLGVVAGLVLAVTSIGIADDRVGRQPSIDSSQSEKTPVTASQPTGSTSMNLSPETRRWFRNPDGSCVQCSIGMCGVHCNDINAASLLWDTQYGSAERGGSWPSRVERYCDRRGIKAWSVTGSSVDETLPWMAWSCDTGRFAAIGAGSAHFQTLYGFDREKNEWLVCNNNSTDRIDRYDDQSFRRLHAASGPWVVILEKPSSPPPELRKWWR